MMGLIFRQAQHVLACIGSSDDKNEAAIRMLSECNSRRATKCQTGQCGYGCREDGHKLQPWAVSSRPIDVFQVWILCHRLVERPYFERVWTMPESLLAANVSFYLGQYRISWQVLHDVLQCLRYNSRPDMNRLWMQTFYSGSADIRPAHGR